MVIGNNCLIHSNVAIYDHTIIGDDVIIHAGTVIGGDAFYYKKRPEGFDQLLSGGRVVIENNVGVVWNNFAVYIEFPNITSNQLGILRSKI